MANNNEIDRLRQEIADLNKSVDALSRINRGSKGNFQRPPTSFNNSSNMITDMISSKSEKMWKDVYNQQKKLGEPKIYDNFIKNLEKLSDEMEKNGKKSSSKLLKSYKTIIEANKGNVKLQSKLNTLIEEYSSKLVKYSDLIDTSKGGKYTKEMGEDIRAQRKSIDGLVAEMKAAGLDPQEVKKAQYMGKKKGYSVDGLHSVAGEMQQANEAIVEQTSDHVDALEAVQGKEINARMGMVKAIGKFAFDVLNKSMGAVDSRLQNVLSDTQFTTAAMTGMSPQEMNEWSAKNRNTLRLLGDSADTYTSNLQSMLGKYGYFGKDAADQATKLQATGMQAGIAPSGATLTGMQDSVQQYKVLTGATSDEANQYLSDIANSSSFMAASVNKSGAEQLDIVYKQMVSLSRIAKSSGYSSDYLQSLLQEQQSGRYKSVIDAIKTAVLTKPLMNEMEKVSGVKMNETERLAFSMKQNNALDETKGNEFYEAYLAYQTKYSAALSSRRKSDAGALTKGDINSSSGRLALDAFAGLTNFNQEEYETAGIAAGNRRKTVGASTPGQDELVKIAEASVNSYSTLEEIYQALNTYVTGFGKSPIGGLGGVISSIAESGFDYAIMRQIVAGLLPAGGTMAGGAVAGEAAAVGGGGAAVGGTAAAGSAAWVLGPLLAGLAGYGLTTAGRDAALESDTTRDAYLAAEENFMNYTPLGLGLKSVADLFGNGNLDRMAQIQELERNYDSAKVAATSGQQFDEDGNKLESADYYKEQILALVKIQENTSKTADNVAASVDLSKTEAEKRDIKNKLEAAAAEQTDSMRRAISSREIATNTLVSDIRSKL